MSKYIRTKDGIYKLLEVDSCGVYFTDDLKHFYKSEIIAQADTIKELCDGFVFKDTCTNKLHLADLNDGISMLGIALFKETFRGFIETDKGLIYVAKMNEKGELELL